MQTSIWLSNPSILLKYDHLKDIWPLPNMTAEERVNSVIRLIILLSLVGYLLTLSYKIFYIAFIAIMLITLLYYVNHPPNKDAKKPEAFSNQLPGVYPEYTNPEDYELNKDKYSKPTVSNPLMNVLLPEIYYDPKRKPAAPTFNPNVEEEINKSVKEFVGKEFHDKNIDKKLFHDLGDKIAFDRSMIPFNGTANTQVPNDQKAFKEYLYGDMISGKEGNPFALERVQTGAYSIIP